jgi:hypothetical protein
MGAWLPTPDASRPLQGRVTKAAVLASVLALAGCGGSSAAPSSPTAPTSSAAPTSFNVSVTLTDSLTGATVGAWSQMATALPIRANLSAPGYISRDTYIQSRDARVDLFPEASFDLQLYRQFARNGLESPTSLQPLLVLEQPPAFFIETEGANGFSRQVAVRLEAVARRTVPSLTGGIFQVTRWEAGPSVPPPQNGWITIERSDLVPPRCGQALVGARAGRIEIDTDTSCNVEAVLAHEIGHALGFWHVERQGALMYRQQRSSNLADAPIEAERNAAAFAYKRRRGNLDVDVDPTPTAAPSGAGVLVID